MFFQLPTDTPGIRRKNSVRRLLLYTLLCLWHKQCWCWSTDAPASMAAQMRWLKGHQLFRPLSSHDMLSCSFSSIFCTLTVNLEIRFWHVVFQDLLFQATMRKEHQVFLSICCWTALRKACAISKWTIQIWEMWILGGQTPHLKGALARVLSALPLLFSPCLLPDPFIICHGVSLRSLRKHAHRSNKGKHGRRVGGKMLF